MLSWNDLDRLNRLLEQRADLLNASSRLLEIAVQQHRMFTEREQNAWTWAMARIDELGAQVGDLTSYLAERHQLPRVR